MWGLEELFDAALKFLGPVAQSALTTGAQMGIQRLMQPSPPSFDMGAPISPTQATAAGAGAAGQGKTGPTSMNFQGGFTGAAPSDPSQGPKPMSQGFQTLDPMAKKKPMGFGSVGV